MGGAPNGTIGFDPLPDRIWPFGFPFLAHFKGPTGWTFEVQLLNRKKKTHGPRVQADAEEEEASNIFIGFPKTLAQDTLKSGRT